MADHFNPWTGAFIHSIEPVRLHMLPQRRFPVSALNILGKLHDLPDYRRDYGWTELFHWCARPEEADFLVFPADLNYFEGRERDVLDLLPGYAAAPERYLFVDHRDDVTLPFDRHSVYLKTSLPENPAGRVMSLPQLDGVDDFLPFILDPPPPLDRDLFFIGQRSP